MVSPALLAKALGVLLETDHATEAAEALRSVAKDETKVQQQEWSMEGMDRYFPTPFNRFILTGKLPTPAVLLSSAWSISAGSQPAAACAGSAEEGAEQELAEGRVMSPHELPAPPCGDVLQRCITFIVGCGRSGTTLAGKLAACHPHVVYLNEPRALFLRAECFRECDVWSIPGPGCAAWLRSGESLSIPHMQAKLGALRRLLWWELVLSALPELDEDSAGQVRSAVAACQPLPEAVVRAVTSAKHLVVKLPEHAFHVPLLQAALGSASPPRVVHVTRPLAGVVKSICSFGARAWLGGLRGAGGHAKWGAMLQATTALADAEGVCSAVRQACELLCAWWASLTAEQQHALRHSPDCTPGARPAMAEFEWWAAVLSVVGEADHAQPLDLRRLIKDTDAAWADLCRTAGLPTSVDALGPAAHASMATALDSFRFRLKAHKARTPAVVAAAEQTPGEGVPPLPTAELEAAVGHLLPPGLL